MKAVTIPDTVPDMIEPRIFPKDRILPKGETPEFYVNSFLAEFGAEIGKSATFTDVTGTDLIISEELFKDHRGNWKVLKRGRETYVLMLSDTLKEPDEIWKAIEETKHGSSEKRRYLAQWKVEGEEKPAMVVFSKDGETWGGTTAFTPDDIDYLKKQKKDELLWER